MAINFAVKGIFPYGDRGPSGLPDKWMVVGDSPEVSATIGADELGEAQKALGLAPVPVEIGTEAGTELAPEVAAPQGEALGGLAASTEGTVVTVIPRPEVAYFAGDTVLGSIRPS